MPPATPTAWRSATTTWANDLRRADRDPVLVVAHRLAAALLDYQTGGGGLAATVRVLAGELAEFGQPVARGPSLSWTGG
jgi:hypothetical protein